MIFLKRIAQRAKRLQLLRRPYICSASHLAEHPFLASRQYHTMIHSAFSRIKLIGFYFDSNSPSHFATTAEARQFPKTLIEVRPMSIRASIPNISITGAAGKPNEATVADNITRD